MKTRRWILVIALFVAFTALVVYHGWSLFEANARIKSYLLTKIRPVLGEDVYIDELEMALGAVHLKGVEVHFKDDYFTLWVKDLRVGLNLFSLIRHGFRPQKIPHDIIFVNPRLTIKPNYQYTGADTIPVTESVPVSPEKYLEKVKKFDFIKRITISKGEINFIDSLYQPVQLAYDINGWLSSRDIGYVYTRLVGKLVHTENFNLMITGNIDLGLGRIDSLNLKLKNFQLREKIPVFIPDYLDIKSGTVDGSITLFEKGMGRSGFDITGNIDVSQAAFQMKDNKMFFDDFNLKATIDEWDCIVDSASFLFNGSPVTVDGRIKNILNPRLDLHVDSKQFDVEKYMAYHTSGVKLRGTAGLDFHITNTYENPKITGILKSSRLGMNSEKFNDISASVALNDSVFQVSKFTGWIDSVRIDGNGRIDFRKKTNNISFSMNGNGPVFKHLLPAPIAALKSSSSKARIHCSGDWTKIAGTLSILTKPTEIPDTTYIFDGNFALANRELKLEVNSRSHHMKGSALVEFGAEKPAYKMKLTGLHDILFGFSEFKTVQNFLDLRMSAFEITGNGENVHIDGDMAWNPEKGGNPRSAMLACDVSSEDSLSDIEMNWEITSGDSQFKSNLKLVKTPRYLRVINFDIDDVFFSSGQIELNEERAIEANIIFPDASLPDLNRLIFNHPKSAETGKVFGSVGISGTLKNPVINGEMDFIDVVINKIGTYEGGMTFQLINQTLVLNELLLKHDRNLVLTSSGSYDLKKDVLNFNVYGKHIDLNSMLTTLFNKSDFLQGTSSAELRVQGSLKQPRFMGIVEAENGKIGKFAFDKMIWELGRDESQAPFVDEYDLNSGNKNGLFLQRVSIIRTGQFQMNGAGMIPFSDDTSMDIRLNGKGNILSILPEITPFFKETASKGEWIFHLGGSPGNFVVSNASISLTDGYLRLGGVAPEINDLNIDMELEQDGFLNVKFISGKIKKREFKFSNVPAAPEVIEMPLEPFTIPELGLNLGIFTLETHQKGVPLYVPGFMEKGEIGDFQFSGKNPNEKFYFAGPTERPMVRGTILLQNVNFTFPFITDDPEKAASNPVVQALRMIDWNVSAEVGKNLHYQRQIPSGLDNVYVDLIVDAGVGGLEFNGVLNEKTFGVTGKMESSRGTVEYLDLDFQVTKAGVEFDMDVTRKADVEFDKSTLLPIIYGEARTTVTDSTGFPYYIYLTMLTVDKVTGHKLKRGRLGDVVFELSSESQELGDTEGEILASLGYSATNIREKATDIIGISTDNLLFRPLFRPFERQLERTLGLDMVRFSSRFTRNLIEMNVKDEKNFQFDSRLFLLRSTKLMVGKYLADRLFLLYTGQLEAGLDYRYQQEGFGLRHTLGLEYRINPSLLLQMEYDYNSLLLWQREDKKILLRHSFPF